MIFQGYNFVVLSKPGVTKRFLEICRVYIKKKTIQKKRPQKTFLLKSLEQVCFGFPLAQLTFHKVPVLGALFNLGVARKPLGGSGDWSKESLHHGFDKMSKLDVAESLLFQNRPLLGKTATGI